LTANEVSKKTPAPCDFSGLIAPTA